MSRWNPFAPPAPAPQVMHMRGRTGLVLAGENTSALAARLRVSVPQLLAANPKLPRVIVQGRHVFADLRPGQIVFLPLDPRVCPPGSRFDSAANACMPFYRAPGSCPPGTHWDNGVCLPDSEMGVAGASPAAGTVGYELPGTCPDGTHWDSGDCLPDTAESPPWAIPGTCPEGTSWDVMTGGCLPDVGAADPCANVYGGVYCPLTSQCVVCGPYSNMDPETCECTCAPNTVKDPSGAPGCVPSGSPPPDFGQPCTHGSGAPGTVDADGNCALLEDCASQGLNKCLNTAGEVICNNCGSPSLPNTYADADCQCQCLDGFVPATDGSSGCVPAAAEVDDCGDDGFLPCTAANGSPWCVPCGTSILPNTYADADCQCQCLPGYVNAPEGGVGCVLAGGSTPSCPPGQTWNGAKCVTSGIVPVKTCPDGGAPNADGSCGRDLPEKTVETVKESSMWPWIIGGIAVVGGGALIYGATKTEPVKRAIAKRKARRALKPGTTKTTSTKTTTVVPRR